MCIRDRQEWRWSEKYAAQPELLEYAGFVADKYDLRRDFAFETKVEAAHWDAKTGRWVVKTDQGDLIRARFCVMATGCLSVPREPRIEGEHDFKGEVYHTAVSYTHLDVYKRQGRAGADEQAARDDSAGLPA